MTYQLEREADLVVYHCVDLLYAVEHIHSVAVLRGEGTLAQHAQIALATSDAVAEHLRDVGFRDVHNLPNVADVSVFSAASRPPAEKNVARSSPEHYCPEIGRRASRWKSAESLGGRARLVLAGPLGPGGRNIVRALERKGARYLGPLSTGSNWRALLEDARALIPYRSNAYTRGVSPLKCFEYLASGMSVLSTPSLRSRPSRQAIPTSPLPS